MGQCIFTRLDREVVRALCLTPSLTAAGSAFGHEMADAHGVVARVLFALIGMHVAAPLFHRFVLHDQVMQRMLP
jgi:cytochrome b561